MGVGETGKLRAYEKVAVKGNLESACNRMAFGAAESPEEIATNIFRLFRDCDRLEDERIYVEAIPKTGIGLAVMNRLEKAAAGRMIQVE